MKSKSMKIAKCIIFLLILLFLVVHITYLLRNISYGRNNVGGITQEEGLDVVCIGGSSTAVYWKPLLAWNEFGMLSYNYASDSFRIPLTIGAVKEVLRAQDPDLLVLDMRSFTRGEEEMSDVQDGVRNMTDSMNFNLNRFQTVLDVLNFYGANIWVDDNISYLFDIIKYHTNTAALADETAWNHLNNNTEAEHKGFLFVEFAYNDILEEPEGLDTDEEIPIEKNAEEYLIELLDYLKTQDVDVLFVQGPIPIDIETQKKTNYIEKIVSSYGYEFLNTNSYYDEMGIDFSKDFYNAGHVNAYGADKYTLFVGQFIKEHYNIEDHSNDTECKDEWDTAYTAFVGRDNEIKARIDNLYNSKVQAKENWNNIKNTNDVNVWSSYVYNENYFVVIATKGEGDYCYLPWQIGRSNKYMTRVYNGLDAVVVNDGALENDYVYVRNHYNITVNSAEKFKFQINDEEISTEEEGIYVGVFDNNYDKMVDVIRIFENEGQIEMEHIVE